MYRDYYKISSASPSFYQLETMLRIPTPKLPRPTLKHLIPTLEPPFVNPNPPRRWTEELLQEQALAPRVDTCWAPSTPRAYYRKRVMTPGEAVFMDL